MPDFFPVTLDEMAKEAIREAGYRRKVYPTWVRMGKLRQDKAERQILVMESIADKLVMLVEAEGGNIRKFTE